MLTSRTSLVGQSASVLTAIAHYHSTQVARGTFKYRCTLPPFISGNSIDATLFGSLFETAPEPLSAEERDSWLAKLEGVSLGSDAFFPFRDSVDRAALSGVE